MLYYPISTRINKSILREVLATLNRNGLSGKYLQRQEYDGQPGLVLAVNASDAMHREAVRCLMQVTDQFRVCLDCGDPVKLLGEGFVHLTDEPVRPDHNKGVVRTTTDIDEGPLGDYEMPRLRRSRKHRSSKQVVTLIGEIVAKYKESR